MTSEREPDPAPPLPPPAPVLAMPAPRPSLSLWVGLGLAIASLVALALPFAGWLVLAAWLAAAGRPLLAVLESRLHGRKRAAAVVTLSSLFLILGPVVSIVASLTLDAVQLGQRLAASDSGREALAQLVSSEGQESPTFDPAAVFAFFEQHGTRAIELASLLAGYGAQLILGLFVFFSAAYVFLVDGPKAWGWALGHAPFGPQRFERLRSAFHETGRGLFVGIGLTGLTQATIGTIAYMALGVPRAFVLGLLTLFASVLPTVGTGLVWAPVAIALVITGRPSAALILMLVGGLVMSSIDNVLRPVLARWGHLDLHAFVLMIAMLSGLALMGTSGLFLGPLMARLAVETIRMAREADMIGHPAPPPPSV